MVEWSQTPGVPVQTKEHTMFTLPTPWADTPYGRNEVRLEDLKSRLTSARNNLQLATEALDAAIATFDLVKPDATLAKTYTTSEVVGRNLAEVARLQARYNELALEIMAIASSLEITR